MALMFVPTCNENGRNHLYYKMNFNRMIGKVGVVALLMAVALSGCATDDAPPALTDADCAALGQVLSTSKEMESGHEHGEAMDDGHEDGSHTAEPMCVDAEPAGPRGIVTLDVVPAEVSKYTTVSMNWTLGTTNADGKDHAMDTRIMMGTEPLTDSQAKPDDYGTQLAQSTHQNFDHGAVYSANYSFVEEGSFYLYAFALIGGDNIWSEAAMITVGPVAATDMVHEITVTGSGPSAAIDKSSHTIRVGDAIKFVNDDLLPRTFDGNGFTVTVEGQGGESAEIMFVEPGSVSYTTTTDLSPLGDLSGSINVQS
jgi:plastocyanin